MENDSLFAIAFAARLAALYVVSAILQYRITFELELREQETILVGVGSHGEV